MTETAITLMYFVSFIWFMYKFVIRMSGDPVRWLPRLTPHPLHLMLKAKRASLKAARAQFDDLMEVGCASPKFAQKLSDTLNATIEDLRSCVDELLAFVETEDWQSQVVDPAALEIDTWKLKIELDKLPDRVDNLTPEDLQPPDSFKLGDYKWGLYESDLMMRRLIVSISGESLFLSL